MLIYSPLRGFQLHHDLEGIGSNLRKDSPFLGFLGSVASSNTSLEPIMFLLTCDLMNRLTGINTEIQANNTLKVFAIVIIARG